MITGQLLVQPLEATVPAPGIITEPAKGSLLIPLSGESLRLLCGHAFRELFVEYFGWERHRGQLVANAGDKAFVLHAVAHKRGFQVFHCPIDRYSIVDRIRLRAIQKQLATVAHEHILIYTCEEPRRQVWQWGLRLADGGKLRHLEHPFFSNQPPAKFLARLTQLRFAQEDEETVTLLDAIDRVRSVLNAEPELELFAKRPWYSQQSDQLARAMKAGGVKEFQDFIVFHSRLIRWFADRWQRRFHVDSDEAEQLCAIGVMQAAQRFDPTRGFQFATYASCATKRTGRRLAAEIRFPIHLPQYVLPFCFQTRRLLESETVATGPHAAREAIERHLATRQKPFVQAWRTFESLLERASLSDRRDPVSKLAMQVPAKDELPNVPMLRRQIYAMLQALIDRLEARERQIVRLYHGFEGEPLTLQEVGDRLGLTRERIRQILVDIHARLRTALDAEPEELRCLLEA